MPAHRRALASTSRPRAVTRRDRLFCVGCCRRYRDSSASGATRNADCRWLRAAWGDGCRCSSSGAAVARRPDDWRFSRTRAACPLLRGATTDPTSLSRERGSCRLAALIRSLLDQDLVDEIQLIVVPVVLGQGARLFPDAGPDIALDLVDSRTDSKGVTIQVFRPNGRPQYAT